MLFPETKHVQYKNNSLDKVICQLRFPPILKIDTEMPSTFQDKIRKDFPNFTENVNSSLSFPEQIIQNKVFSFSSEDNNWKINITRTFIAIVAKEYKSWKEFCHRFENPLTSFINIYQPSFFTRVGLRYIDIFSRKKLCLDGKEWKDLISDKFSGLLNDSDIANKVNSFSNAIDINIDDTSKIMIKTGFVLNKEKEKCFLLDSDFYIQDKVLTENALAKLDFLHKYSLSLFRFAIKDELHNAMGPNE